MTVASRFAFGLLGLASILAVRGVYVDMREGAWVGAGVMLALLVIAYVAGRSLYHAARFFERERGDATLAAERKRTVEALTAKGIRPDLSALRESTAAAVATRGYVGRYFVAATILVGLVGTFAGLMTTLGDLTPMLSGGTASFRGLDLTFGSSLVAIVITLGLTLMHGEVVALEAAVLSRLDERTAHEWTPPVEHPLLSKLDALLAAQARPVPHLQHLEELHTLRLRVDTLLPAFDKVASHIHVASERIVDDFGQRLSTFTNEVTARVALLASRVEEQQAESLARSSRTLEQTTSQLLQTQMLSAQSIVTAHHDAAARTAALLEANAQRLADAQQLAATEITAVFEATTAKLTTSQDSITRAAGSVLESLVERTSQALEATTASLASSQQELVGRTTAALEQSAKRLADAQETAALHASAALESAASSLSASQAELVSRTTAALEQSTAKLADAQKNAAIQAAGALESATTSLALSQDELLSRTAAAFEATAQNQATHAGQLEQAAQHLALSAEQLAPIAQKLAEELLPQMRALAEQVALVASDAKDAELDVATFTELERIGNGMEELRKLLQVAHVS